MKNNEDKKFEFSIGRLIFLIIALGSFVTIILIFKLINSDSYAARVLIDFMKYIKSYFANKDFVGIVLSVFKITGYAIVIFIIILLFKSFFDKSNMVYKKIEEILIKLQIHTVDTFKKLVELLGEIPELVKSIRQIVFGMKSEKPLVKVLNTMIVCISIVSFSTTAYGLTKYFFEPGDYKAALISIAVQITLLALGINIPIYIKKANYKKAYLVAMVSVYAIVMVISSGFSYVYFSTLINDDTLADDMDYLRNKIYFEEITDFKNIVDREVENYEISCTVDIMTILSKYEEQTDTVEFDLENLVSNFVVSKKERIDSEETDILNFINYVDSNKSIYSFEGLLSEISNEMENEFSMQYRIDSLTSDKEDYEVKISDMDKSTVGKGFGYSLEPKEAELFNSFIETADEYREELDEITEELEKLEGMKSNRDQILTEFRNLINVNCINNNENNMYLVMTDIYDSINNSSDTDDLVPEINRLKQYFFDQVVYNDMSLEDFNALDLNFLLDNLIIYNTLIGLRDTINSDMSDYYENTIILKEDFLNLSEAIKKLPAKLGSRDYIINERSADIYKNARILYNEVSEIETAWFLMRSDVNFLSSIAIFLAFMFDIMVLIIGFIIAYSRDVDVPLIEDLEEEVTEDDI